MSVRVARRVVAADAVGGLGQIVGARTRRTPRLGDIAGYQAGALQLDHGAELIGAIFFPSSFITDCGGRRACTRLDQINSILDPRSAATITSSRRPLPRASPFDCVAASRIAIFFVTLHFGESPYRSDGLRSRSAEADHHVTLEFGRDRGALVGELARDPCSYARATSCDLGLGCGGTSIAGGGAIQPCDTSPA